MSRESRKRAIERARAAERRRRRQRQLLIAVGGLVVIGGIAGGIVAATGSGTPAAGNSSANNAALASLGTLQPAPAPGQTGAEGVPVPAAAPLAGTAAAVTGQSVDGISCNTAEQTIFHIHAHLVIIVNGTPRQVPAAIGIPGAVTNATQAGPFVGSGRCFYWLHTHAPDGIIHIESPVQRTYTLGDFFDEWGQSLGPNQVGPAAGHVTVILNRKIFSGNPRDVPLTAHAQIELEVGTPLVAPEAISWPNGL